MEPDDTLPCLQETATGPYLEPNEPSSYAVILFLQDPS
jgi:hypothetical protein